jgi:peptidoglycan hydrolase-like amidase
MRPQITLIVLMLAGSLASAQEVRIGVFGLFHPGQLIVSAPTGSVIIVHAGQQSFAVENSSGENTVNIQPVGNGLVGRCGTHSVESPELTVSSRENGPVDFLISVPGKITRHYRGRLEIEQAFGTLIPVVSMDIETAVASVVAAESMPGAPMEALKAQAVAARSYFAAGNGRHDDFDFCDTTHCQFLRQAPGLEAAASKATIATRGFVIAYQSRVFAAMYTRTCSGHTRTPADIGLPDAAYPYYSVECKYCRQHPTNWKSRISVQDATHLRSSDDTARIEVGRRLGWNVIQSDDFTLRKRGEQVIVEGSGQGHGVGLCQAGAREMAEEGSDFRKILAHYYPNTTVMSLAPESTRKR